MRAFLLYFDLKCRVFKKLNMLSNIYKDYVGSGYDRGHLVPAADLKQSQKAMDESFYLTNIRFQFSSTHYNSLALK